MIKCIGVLCKTSRTANCQHKFGQKLPYSLRLSRRAKRVIAQNMAIAIGVMAILVVGTLSVGIALPLAVIGHEGSTIIVVLNGLRLMRMK